jgi:hypothetical protein
LQNFRGFSEKCNIEIKIPLEFFEEKQRQNPKMTVEEWQQTKSEFMTFLFCMFVKETPESIREMGEHIYNEINGGKRK